MAARSPRPTGLWWALASAFASVAWVLLYVSVLSAESGEPSARSLFVALFVLATGVAVLVGSFLQHPLPRIAFTSAAAAGQFAWAVLGLASVGLPLFLPAALSTVVATLNAEAEESSAAPGGALLGVVGSLAVVVLGLVLTPGAP